LKWRLRASGLDFNEDELFDHPLRLSSCTAKRLNEEQFLARKSRHEQTKNNDDSSEENNINDDNDAKSNTDDKQRERMMINEEQQEAEEKAAALFINSRTRKRYQRLSGRDRLLAILKSKLVGGGVGGYHRLQHDDDEEDESTKRETGKDHERNRKLFDRLLKTMKNDVDADDLEEKPILLGLTRVHLILTCFGILIVAIVGLICLKRTSQPSAPPSSSSASCDQNKIQKPAKKKK